MPSAKVTSASSGLKPANGAVITYCPSFSATFTGRRRNAGSLLTWPLAGRANTSPKMRSTLRSSAASSENGFLRVVNMTLHLLFDFLPFEGFGVSLPTVLDGLNAAFDAACLGRRAMWYFRRWVAEPPTHGLLPDQKRRR